MSADRNKYGASALIVESLADWEMSADRNSRREHRSRLPSLADWEMSADRNTTAAAASMRKPD